MIALLASAGLSAWPPSGAMDSASPPHGNTMTCLKAAAAELHVRPPIDRVAILDIQGVQWANGVAAPFYNVSLALLGGGWNIVFLRDAPDSGDGDWDKRFVAFSGTVTQKTGASVSAITLLTLPRQCAASVRTRALVGVFAASRAGADTILHVAHWRGIDALTEWPRYYPPTAALPVLKDARDASRVLETHFFAAARAQSSRRSSSNDLRLCVSARTAPLLQLGLCAAPYQKPLTEATGVIIPVGLAAATLRDARYNALAYRPAFGALAALIAAAGDGETASAPSASLDIVAAALYAVADYDTAVLAPGSLCSDANQEGAGTRPTMLWEIQKPPVDRDCLIHGCVAPAANGSDASVDAAPVLKDPLDLVNRPTAAALLQAVASALRHAGAAGDSIVVAVARSWSASLVGIGSSVPLPPRSQLVRGDLQYVMGFPEQCFSSRPWLRDIPLAVVFNYGKYALPPLLALLRELYEGSFPYVFFMSSASDDASLGRLECATGPGGNDAHVCFTRAAPILFGRVGLMWTMDDALITPWNLANYDARKLWFIQGQPSTPGGNLGPSSYYHNGNTITSELTVKMYADWGARPGFVTPAMTAMRERNAADLGRGVDIVRGTTDSLYIPRPLFARWAYLCQPSSAAGMMQEVFFPTIALSTVVGLELQIMTIHSWPRGVGPTGGDPAKVIACGLYDPTQTVTHPWKMGTSEAASAYARERFAEWYSTGVAPRPTNATPGFGKAECTAFEVRRRTMVRRTTRRVR